MYTFAQILFKHLDLVNLIVHVGLTLIVLCISYRVEGVFALQEAIRLAQQHNNSLILEYALVIVITDRGGY